jgi:hypothetical protein
VGAALHRGVHRGGPTVPAQPGGPLVRRRDLCEGSPAVGRICTARSTSTVKSSTSCSAPGVIVHPRGSSSPERCAPELSRWRSPPTGPGLPACPERTCPARVAPGRAVRKQPRRSRPRSAQGPTATDAWSQAAPICPHHRRGSRLRPEPTPRPLRDRHRTTKEAPTPCRLRRPRIGCLNRPPPRLRPSANRPTQLSCHPIAGGFGADLG